MNAVQPTRGDNVAESVQRHHCMVGVASMARVSTATLTSCEMRCDVQAWVEKAQGWDAEGKEEKARAGRYFAALKLW